MAVLELQNDMLDRLMDIQRSWCASAKCGANLSSEILMAATLAYADASDAYRQRMEMHLDLSVETARRLIVLGESLASIGARSLTRDWKSESAVYREESSGTVRRAEAA